MKQRSKFFCENCGAEVPAKARFCKHCGKFFTATRCPKCGATGPSSDFVKGCPECGYAVGGENVEAPAEDSKRRLSHIEKKKLKSAFRAATTNGLISTAPDTHDGTLPAWVYAITATATLAAFISVYSCIK